MKDNRRGAAHRSDSAGVGLAVVAAVGFATLAISAKFAYREGAHFIPLLAARFALASLLLAVYRVATKQRRPVPRRAVLRLILLGAFGYGFESALFFAALERAPAGVVGLIFYSYPLWTTLIAFSTRLERFRWQLVVALAMGVAGIVLVFSLPRGDTVGLLLALAAAVSVAVYFIFMQVALRVASSSVAATWTTVGAAGALAIAAVVVGEPLPAGAWPWAGALGIASAFAFITLYAAIARIGSSRAAIAATVEPVTTLLLAALLLGEELTLRIVAGAALIVAALPLLATDRGAEPLPPPDSV